MTQMHLAFPSLCTTDASIRDFDYCIASLHVAFMVILTRSLAVAGTAVVPSVVVPVGFAGVQVPVKIFEGGELGTPGTGMALYRLVAALDPWRVACWPGGSGVFVGRRMARGGDPGQRSTNVTTRTLWSWCGHRVVRIGAMPQMPRCGVVAQFSRWPWGHRERHRGRHRGTQLSSGSRRQEMSVTCWTLPSVQLQAGEWGW